MFARKAFNFDLDTKALKGVFGNTRDGYRILKNEFISNGFSHRQWSGYVSKNKMADTDAAMFITNLANKQPWLAQCVKKFDVTDVGRAYDVTIIIKSARTSNSFSSVSGSNAPTAAPTYDKNNPSPTFLDQINGMVRRPTTNAKNVAINKTENVNE